MSDAGSWIHPSVPVVFVDVNVDRRGMNSTRVAVAGTDDISKLNPDAYIAMGVNVSSAATLMPKNSDVRHRTYVDLSSFRWLHGSMEQAIAAATINSMQRIIDGAANGVRTVAVRVDTHLGMSSRRCLENILKGISLFVGRAEGAELFSSVNIFAMFLGADVLQQGDHQRILEAWRQTIILREEVDLQRAPLRALVDTGDDEVVAVNGMFTHEDVGLINQLLEDAWADRKKLTVPQRPTLDWLHTPHVLGILDHLANNHAAYTSEEILDRLGERLTGPSICRFFLAPDGGLVRAEAWEGGIRINALGSNQRSGSAVDALMYRHRITRRLRYVPVEYTLIAGGGPHLKPFMRWFHGQEFERARRDVLTQETLTQMMFPDGIPADVRLKAFLSLVEKEHGLSGRIAELHAAGAGAQSVAPERSGAVVRWLSETARAGSVDRMDEVGVFHLERLIRQTVGDDLVERVLAGCEQPLPSAMTHSPAAMTTQLTLVGGTETVLATTMPLGLMKR